MLKKETYYFTSPTLSEISQAKTKLVSKLKLSVAEIDNLPYYEFEALCGSLSENGK